MQEQCEAHEEMLHRLNRRLRTLSQCNSTCFQAESEQELLQSICEILVAGGECRLAWIGYCEYDAEQTVRPVAQAGDGLDYLERVKVSWGEAETGQGPAGIAVRTGKACWVNDIRTDPRFAPWRGAALGRGYASCIAVPLIAYGKSRGAVELHGTLNLYSAECNAFDEHTIDYYTGLAASVTYAVTALRGHLAEDLTYGVMALRASAERKRSQEELRRSEAYLAEAQRLSHTGSWARDIATGESTHVSGEYARLFGFDPDRDRPSLEAFRQRIHPEDCGRVVDIIEGAVRARTEFEVDFRTMLPDGTIKYLHGIGHPVVNEAGDPVEYIGTAIDVTERKHREEERERLLASERVALAEAVAASEALQKAQAELAHVTRVTTLGELATSIAHEINQPLSAIVTNGSACLRWLAGAAPNLDEARAAVQCIIDDGQRASAIITRIRALLRKTATEKARLDINHLVHEVVRLTQQEIVRQGVALRLDLAADLPPVWGDRVQLQQVLLNLVMNGIEAMAGVAQGPRALVVRSRPEAAGTVLVAVEDTGTGIAQEQLEAIFTAFYTTKVQGLGMGLAISRTIVEQHGGRLLAVPHDGPGATVQFTLLTDHGEGEGQGHKSSSGSWTTWQGERR